MGSGQLRIHLHLHLKMAASNIVIFLVSQVVVATDRRIHLNKPVQEAEWTRLPVRMIDIPCLLKYYGFVFSNIGRTTKSVCTEPFFTVLKTCLTGLYMTTWKK